MFGEIMGRATGCCRGKGGSMHLAEARLGFMGENPVVGSNTPMALGLALAAKLSGSGRVVADFFGEGALNTGAFNEAANLAVLWGLPVLLLCENNLYAISVPVEKSSALADLAGRACSFGLEGRRVNGMRVRDVYDAVSEAAARARADQTPVYLVFDTYRFEGHHTSDKKTYRTAAEAQEEFRSRDPIHILEREMIDDHTVSIPTTIEYRDRIRAEIDDAFARALEAPWPDAREALVGVYAEAGVS
jgi:pyruvate dehydrogenase E1 component alpha subunit